MKPEPSIRACCPKCDVKAEGRGPIEIMFGFRRNQGYQQPQSWCRRCRKGLLPLGEDPFKGILADPPWQYEVKGLQGVADDQYPTMPTKDICAMPVEAVSAQNSVLLLWVTNPFLEEGLRVVKSWGFRYKTKIVWCKNTVGVGKWAQGCTEDLFIATRGKPPPPDIPVRGVLHAKNRGHSQKPPEMYPVAERLGMAPRLELFARQRRTGWLPWGNQLSNTIITTLQEVLA